MAMIELSKDEVTRLLEMLSWADLGERPVKIFMRPESASFKVGEGMWTAPMGTAL
jgi:hypothetical protein